MEEMIQMTGAYGIYFIPLSKFNEAASAPHQWHKSYADACLAGNEESLAKIEKKINTPHRRTRKLREFFRF